MCVMGSTHGRGSSAIGTRFVGSVGPTSGLDIAAPVPGRERRQTVPLTGWPSPVLNPHRFLTPAERTVVTVSHDRRAGGGTTPPPGCGTAHETVPLSRAYGSAVGRLQ